LKSKLTILCAALIFGSSISACFSCQDTDPANQSGGGQASRGFPLYCVSCSNPSANPGTCANDSCGDTVCATAPNVYIYTDQYVPVSPGCGTSGDVSKGCKQVFNSDGTPAQNKTLEGQVTSTGACTPAAGCNS